ncbi:MAG: hypothetical protein HKN54_02720 [Flavobacteriaceae bacterium]|nr:hypothetical protein [Flavobacteriaceae bacterium]
MEKAMYSGNYDHAIHDALKKLHTNKSAKWKTKFVILLEESYHKAIKRDLQTIKRLQKANDPALNRQIFEIYANMDARQEAIKPVLPLRVGKKIINFQMKDFTDDLILSRNDAVDYEYRFAKRLMASQNKYDFREAYKILEFIESVKPDHDQVRAMMDEAHFKGTDFVLVAIKNDTHQILPHRLEDELLNFDTYGLNNFWTTYHSNADAAIDYDFGMELQLRNIQISPERMLERQHLRERELVDGWEYQYDEQGNVAKDSLGNDIKIDRIINVRARVFEIEQIKSTRVLGRVVYTDLKSNQPLESFPLDSEFVFQNIFGRYRGDKRALTDHDHDLINRRRIPFPTNSQMVYDTGEDLKHQLKRILNAYAFND